MLIARLQQALRRTAFGAAGGLFLIIGIGFLTAAAWLAMALAFGAVFASVIVGLVLCGIGLVCLALAARRPVPPSAALQPPVPAARQADLIAAFLGGMDTGKAMARRPSRR